jgi:hypothetical protein
MKLKIGNKIYEFKDDCPEEVINVFKNREKLIDFDVFKKHIGFWPQSKKMVIGFCDVCGSSVKKKMCSVVGDYKIESLKNRLICKNCTMKEVCKDIDWKTKNSKAQKIAQNRPEVLEKMSKSLKKVWSENNEVTKKWRESILKSNSSDEQRLKISKASKKLWQNEDYREKMLVNFRSFNGISGFFNSKFSGRIRFDSSYEFIFLFYCDLKMKKVDRFKGSIKYILNGKSHYYIPDFVIDDVIYEIKSNYKMENLFDKEEILAKKNSAEKFLENSKYKDYFICFEDFLKDFGKFEIRHQILCFCVDNKCVELYSKNKDKFKVKKSKLFDEALIEVNKWNLLK